MKLFREWKAAALFGRGAGKFYRQDYAAAARSLRSALTLDPNMNHVWQTLSLLGRCHLALGESEESLRVLQKAYDALPDDRSTIRRGFLEQEMLRTLKAFSDALLAVGQPDRAKEILHEVKEERLRRK